MKNSRLAMLQSGLDWSQLANADLLLEPVSEDLEVKDAIAKPGAILATNTSYLDVDVRGSH